MRGEQALELAFEKPAESAVPEFIEERKPLTLVQNEMTIDDLIKKPKPTASNSRTLSPARGFITISRIFII
jgi:hypothetical protein